MREGEDRETLKAEEAKPARSGRWGAILAWGVLFLLLVLFGFGLLRREQGQISVGSVVPYFVLTTFDGQEIALQDLAGQVVVINFWSSWCLTCDEEAAALEQAYQLARDSQVSFLGVNYSDADWAALDYLEKYGITYPNGPDEGTRIAQDFRIRSVPETYIVAPDGTLVFMKIGPFSSVEEILEAIESAR
jgi:cytochrome c biogenesis protein CcmG/thiol:disulfide interchange protein DsbE